MTTSVRYLQIISPGKTEETRIYGSFFQKLSQKTQISNIQTNCQYPSFDIRLVCSVCGRWTWNYQRNWMNLTW
jgi:hypothetical protein